MEQNTIMLKSVNELSQYSFFIPSYQRGYRWTKQEVDDLLNDIDEFVPREIKDSNEKTWYCLQPVVVKKLNQNRYEVIDGQQRLTTLYLILFFLNQDFIEERRDRLFSIDYQTREGSKDYLKNPESKDDSNIDFFHIHNAYVAIQNWFERKAEDLNFDKSAFRSKVKFSTKVIWYETAEDIPTKVFTRLNVGKISLTNAELIKALFLNSSNFHTNDEKGMRLRQVEIANEWDGIENALQNNKLWYFLCDEEKDDNRIEFIFNLMDTYRGRSNDPYSTFRYFSQKLAGKSENDMKHNWETVQEYYQRCNEWYSDRELYHKIGFILTAEITNANVSTLYDKSSKMKKSEFKEYLDVLIKTHYKNKKQYLFDLDYYNKTTRSVLLLYNILTMLQNDHDSSHFPFDAFKLNRWNIEHIASRKDSTSVPEAYRKQWLEDVRNYIDQTQAEATGLIGDIDSSIQRENIDDLYFKSIFERVTDHFNKYMTADYDIDGISNLALLDEKTNKSYKNAVFPLKRKQIIDLDKSGGFVPLCTKNVFLKYFSDYPPKISFWTQDDREKYENDLVRVLSDFLEVES